ncbi:transketolase [[Eubacterium] cellulosolvens]
MNENRVNSFLNGNEKIENLQLISLMTRTWIINMIHNARSGHPGGSLSATDIITVLYFTTMQHDPNHPKWEDRDRFVLSKGHAAPALYAILAQAGYFKKEVLINFLKGSPSKISTSTLEFLERENKFDLDLLMTLRELGSPLQGHPDMKRTPGIEASTGSEGQGLSMGIGMARGLRLDKKVNRRVYVMIGDGELDCGQIWEAAMFAAHYEVDNLTVFIDANGLQLDGETREIMGTEPIGLKWKAFGWHVIEIDGHNMNEIIKAIEESKKIKGKPTIIIARTTKGKGVSYMEGAVPFHGKAPNNIEYLIAIKKFLKMYGSSKLSNFEDRIKGSLKKLMEITQQHTSKIPEKAIRDDAEKKAKEEDQDEEKTKKNIEDSLKRKKMILEITEKMIDNI